MVLELGQSIALKKGEHKRHLLDYWQYSARIRNAQTDKSSKSRGENAVEHVVLRRVMTSIDQRGNRFGDLVCQRQDPNCEEPF
jgi:hypothetical protein